MHKSAGTTTVLKSTVSTSIAALVILLPSLAAAQSAPIVLQRFESGAPSFGFAYTFPTDGNYTMTHEATGGPDGSGAVHFRMRAGQTQYNLGWVAGTGSRSYTAGDAVYIRFRIRFDDDHRWLGDGSMQNKFILLGQSHGGPQSRIIVQNEKPHDTTPCGLGFNPYNGSPIRWLPRDYGLTALTWEDSSIRGRYSSLSVKVNIGPECTPPVLITFGTWYDVQIYAKSSSTNTGEYKVWVNNNDVNAPNSQVRGFNLGTFAWHDGMTIGGFMSEAPNADGGFRLDDVVLATAFDPNWAVDETPRPNPPGGLRVE